MIKPEFRDIKIIVYSASLVLALAAFGLFLAHRLSVWPFIVRVAPAPAVVFGEDEKKKVAAKAEEFGQRLKKVSLLSPDVYNEMQSNYGGYVAKPLLDRWKSDPTQALGRTVSSPWPERMEVDTQSIRQLDNKTFRVVGKIDYYSSAGVNTSGPVYSETVVFHEERINGSWLITEFETFEEHDRFPAKYIFPIRWPLTIANSENAFACKPTVPTLSSASKAVSRVVVNGKGYCVTVSREGAAGNVYASYEYTTERAVGGTLSVDFILRYPNCSNYDIVQAAECAIERETFNLDEFIAQRLESVNRPAAPVKELETYVPKTPGFFYDSNTEISFNYPKDWKIMIEEPDVWRRLRIRLYAADGNSVASFALPPLETGIEEVVTVKSANITARDGSVVEEEVFRSCTEWKNGEECLKTSGSVIGWAHWRSGAWYFGGWPANSTEETRHLNELEKLFATLDIGKQPPSAKTVEYINKKFGYTFKYPATWLNYPAAFSVPPLETEPMPSSEADTIFLGPKALLSNCSVLEPYTPARYINIISRDGSLDDNRAELNKRIAGQDYVESKSQLGGKTVYVYDPRSGSVCPDPASDQFKIFLFENKGKVFELMTDLYFMPEVRAVISSLHFAN